MPIADADHVCCHPLCETWGAYGFQSYGGPLKWFCRAHLPAEWRGPPKPQPPRPGVSVPVPQEAS